MASGSPTTEAPRLTDIREMVARARDAARRLMGASRAQKDAALQEVASQLRVQRATLEEANALDLNAGRLAGLDETMLDRLCLDEPRLYSMAEGVDSIARLPDPVGSRGSNEYHSITYETPPRKYPPKRPRKRRSTKRTAREASRLLRSCFGSLSVMTL